MWNYHSELIVGAYEYAAWNEAERRRFVLESEGYTVRFEARYSQYTPNLLVSIRIYIRKES